LKRIYPDIPWVPQIITLYLGNPDNKKNQYSLVVSWNLGVYNVLKMFWVPQQQQEQIGLKGFITAKARTATTCTHVTMSSLRSR
jgi:hypothetical protein